MASCAQQIISHLKISPTQTRNPPQGGFVWLNHFYNAVSRISGVSPLRGSFVLSPTQPFRLACARLRAGLTYCAPTALDAYNAGEDACAPQFQNTKSL